MLRLEHRKIKGTYTIETVNKTTDEESEENDKIKYSMHSNVICLPFTIRV